MFVLLIIWIFSQDAYSAGWVSNAERELAYRKAPRKAVFKVLDSTGKVFFRNPESLQWQKLGGRVQLNQGDLVLIKEESSILIQVDRKNQSKKDAKTKRIAQLLYDQEGVVRLDTNLRREVKVLGNVVQSVSSSRGQASQARKKSILSFQSAWSKARVISFDASIRTNEMDLGRLGDSRQAKGTTGRIKILNPTQDGNIEYRKLPKKMLITWKPTSQFSRKERKYAVFIWKPEQAPSAPVAITDQTFYTYEIKEPGRFKLKIVDLESGAMSDANLNFQVFQRGMTLKGQGRFGDSRASLPKMLPRIYGAFPKEGSTLVGGKFCKVVNFLWEAGDEVSPYYRFDIHSRGASEFENLQEKLSIRSTSERKPGIRVYVKNSRRTEIRDKHTVYSNEEVVGLNLNPGTYRWKVSLLDKTTRVVLKESREYQVICRAGTQDNLVLRNILKNPDAFEERLSVFLMQ